MKQPELTEIEGLHEAFARARLERDEFEGRYGIASDGNDREASGAEQALGAALVRLAPELLRSARLALNVEQQAVCGSGHEGIGCGEQLHFELYPGETVGKGSNVALRCSDCGTVLCPRCAPAHFTSSERRQTDTALRQAAEMADSAAQAKATIAELTAILKVPAGLDAKVIAQGLLDELDAEKRAHAAHHQLENDLTAILGPEPVESAKALVEELRVARFCADEEKERADSNFKSCERIRDKYSAEVNEHATTRAALAERNATIDSMLEVFSTNPEEYRADPIGAMHMVQDRLDEAQVENARLRARVAEAQEYPAAIEEAVARYRGSDSSFAGMLFLDLAAGLRAKLVKP